MSGLDLDKWVCQLCRSGSLDLNIVGQNRAELLEQLSILEIDVNDSEGVLSISPGIELIDLSSVQNQLRSKLALFDWQYKIKTKSTNLDVLDYFDKHQKQNIAIAETQTNGKGRRGNQWLSPFATNLYCTIGVLKSIKEKYLGLLSIVTGLAICRAINKLGISELKLKWPNDLYFQGQKLGGILIESKPVEDQTYFLAIGIGINVGMTYEDLKLIPQAATSLNLIQTKGISRSLLAVGIIQEIVEAIESFDESVIPQLIQEFDDYDAFHDLPITVTTGTESITGKNAGISVQGQLQLQTNQALLEFSAADISLRRTS